MAVLKLPTEAGALLLPEVTLFPHGALPLHIFEPRYRQMLNDALEGDCFFCIGTLRGEEGPDPAACVAPIGTIGLIRASHELPDGRSELLLHGVCRIHFRKWMDHRAYPLAKIEPFLSVDLPEYQEAALLQRLGEALAPIVLQLPENLAEQVRLLLDRSPDVFTTVDAMAQQFVIDPDVRRTILEEPEVANRAEILIQFLNKAGSR